MLILNFPQFTAYCVQESIVSHKQRREHRARGSREAWSPRLAGFQHVSSSRGFTSIWLSLHCFRAAQRHIVRAVKSSGGSKWASVSGHWSYKGANSWVGGKQSPPPSLGGFQVPVGRPITGLLCFSDPGKEIQHSVALTSEQASFYSGGNELKFQHRQDGCV